MKQKILHTIDELLKHNITRNEAVSRLLSLYNVMPSLPERESRCCGRCDGVNDLCVADIICDEHNEMGCEICYGARNVGNEA